MKLAFGTTLEKAPKGYARVRLTEEARGTKRVVREGGDEWLEIGTGKRGEVTQRTFIIICRSIIQTAKAEGIKKIAVQLSLSPFPKLNKIPLPELGSLIAQNFEMANFEFNHFKTKPKEGWKAVEEVLICGTTPKAMQAGFMRGKIIGEEVNAARVLANTPSSDMQPHRLGKAAKDSVKGLPVTVTVTGKKEMEKLGMGAVLAVGKGSGAEPAFITMEYKGAAGPAIVLAGKGVTFDSGGINLKTDGGHEMHMDMSGGAAVIHAVALAARLKLKKHVVGLIPAVENMPGPHAYRIHDIVRSLSGKTIEVLNTDAEGRVILADAITYAKKWKPSVVLDVATLTGAAMVALGVYANGLFTRDDKLAKTLEELGEATGDYLWRLPLWDEYEGAVKGTVGDVANAQMGSGSRYGGATNAAMFLWQFAKDLDCPWAHLDIAPRMTPAPDEELAKGSAGAAVRLLGAFIESWKS